MLIFAFQAYEERRRLKDEAREAAEAAQEAELARAAALRYVKQEAEAAEWMGQISVEEQGQEAEEQQEGQVRRTLHLGCCLAATHKGFLVKLARTSTLTRMFLHVPSSYVHD